MDAEMYTSNHIGNKLTNIYGGNGTNNTVNNLIKFPNEHYTCENKNAMLDIIYLTDEEDIHIIENSSDVETSNIESNKDAVETLEFNEKIVIKCESYGSKTDCNTSNCNKVTDVFSRNYETTDSCKRKEEMDDSMSLKKKLKTRSRNDGTSSEPLLFDEGTSDIISLTSPGTSHMISTHCLKSDTKCKNDAGLNFENIIVIDSDDDTINFNDSDKIVRNPDSRSTKIPSDISVDTSLHKIVGQVSSDVKSVSLCSFGVHLEESLFFEDKIGVKVFSENAGSSPDNSQHRLPRKSFDKHKWSYCQQPSEKNIEIISTPSTSKSSFDPEKQITKSNHAIPLLKEENIKTEDSAKNVPNPTSSKKQSRLRPIFIDGRNVALGHTNGREFSWRGLAMCINLFSKQGHKVVAFVPERQRYKTHTLELHIVKKYEERGQIYFIPSRWVKGKWQMPYDRYIVQCAHFLGGVIVSNSNYRKVMHDYPHWKETIEKRLLMFTWVDNMLMFPTDPLGRQGPSLTDFLKFSD